MKLISLGSGGFHPSELRHTACFMLPTEGILLDAGTSLFRVRDRIVTDHLDVLVSHAHLDHIVGLTYLIELKDTCRIRAYMTPKTADAVRNHLFAEAIFPVEPPFEIVEINAATEYTLGNGCTMTPFSLEHPGGAIGFRIDWDDKSMAYVTDTTASMDADYIHHIRNVDLLVHECYFPDGYEELAQKTGHSYATPVGQVARAASVKQLLIVHVTPTPPVNDPIGIESIQQIFAECLLAEDLQELEF